MTLYVVTQPDPAPGADFSFVVPGRYLYDVTGITATLQTGTPDPLVAADASGNGNDGTVSASPGAPQYVTGVVPGDLALAGYNDAQPLYSAQVALPGAFIGWDHNWTLAFWTRTGASWIGGAPPYFLATGGFLGGGIEVGTGISGGPTGPKLTVITPGPNLWASAGLMPIGDDLPHMVALVFDGAALTAYIDGVLAPWGVTGTVPLAFPPEPQGFIPADSGGGPIMDEYAFFGVDLDAGTIATLCAAGSSFATYAPAVLALTPQAYYHLDGTAPGTGRQPSLIVDNNSNDLEVIPSGFPAVSTPGPYEYSWQPGLRADTQSTDGTLTTIAIPQLLLPAGYTVGSRTLDLQPTDQWSNVTLWWDDAYQQATDPVNDYRFPGPIKLVYQQSGATP